MSQPQNQKLSQSETTTRILCAHTQGKTRSRSVVVLMLLLDWNDLDWKRKLLVILMMMTDDFVFLMMHFLVFCLLALSLKCLYHIIGLSLKWTINVQVWLLFQEIQKAVIIIWLLSSGILAGESSSTDSTPMAAIILLQGYSTSKHAGHYAAAHPWEMFLQHFTVRAYVVILTLLHVSTTHPCYISSQRALHMFLSLQHVSATWFLVSGHL